MASSVICNKFEKKQENIIFFFTSVSSVDVIRRLKVQYNEKEIIIRANTFPTALFGSQDTITVKNADDLPVYLCCGKEKKLIYKGE